MITKIGYLQELGLRHKPDFGVCFMTSTYIEKVPWANNIWFTVIQTLNRTYTFVCSPQFCTGTAGP